MKAKVLTGYQIQHLQDRFGLQIGDIDFTRNRADVFKTKQDGKSVHLKRETICKMLGIAADSPAVEQNGKWCIVKF